MNIVHSVGWNEGRNRLPKSDRLSDVMKGANELNEFGMGLEGKRELEGKGERLCS